MAAASKGVRPGYRPARNGVSNSAMGIAGPGRPVGGGADSVATLMGRQGARELIARQWLAIIGNPSHPHHATMVARAAERLDGAPTVRTEVTGADGGAFEIVRRIVDPASDEDNGKPD